MNNLPPDIALEYWGWTHPPEGIAMGMYGLDERRCESHDELCKWYGLDKETTKRVTDHLDKYETAWDMHEALLQLKDSIAVTASHRKELG